MMRGKEELCGAKKNERVFSANATQPPQIKQTTIAERNVQEPEKSMWYVDKTKTHFYMFSASTIDAVVKLCCLPALGMRDTL